MVKVNSFKIGNKEIGGQAPCFIIAEAGSNHDQNFNKAIKLIDAAVKAGVDAVKFQLFSADKMVTNTNNKTVLLKDCKFRKYGKSLYELYKKSELPKSWLVKLKIYAEKKRLIFCATPFDENAVDLLEKIDVLLYKIASFEITHLPLIKYTALKNKPLILSTGMSTIKEIDKAVKTIKEAKNDQYALLHCSIEYPPKMDDVNLAAMRTISKKFLCPVGYSDHTLGLTVPIAAVARGAKIIEKHFTLDKKSYGPDHAYALEPLELNKMVSAIRDTEKAIGSFHKKPVKAESIYLKRGRRSIYAKRTIKKDAIISQDMIIILKPAIGIEPEYLDLLIGSKAKRVILENEPITWSKIYVVKK